MAEGKFDAQRLYDMMVEYFGSATVKATKRELEDYYSTSINRDLRTYFQMLDSRVSELKHAGQDREQMMLMQKQECFILANNFISDDPLPGQVYLRKMILPFSEVLHSKMQEDIRGEANDLKYLIFTLHDTNISNLLRFLGYWDKYGYSKHVKFASSVRFELFRQ